jgi:hypothetical protein
MSVEMICRKCIDANHPSIHDSAVASCCFSCCSLYDAVLLTMMDWKKDSLSATVDGILLASSPQILQTRDHFFLPTESCNCAWSRSPCCTCIPLSSERLHVGIYFGYVNVYLYDFSSQKHYELAHSGRVMKLYDRQFCTYGLPVAYAAGLGDEVQKIQTNIFSSLCAFNWHSLRCSPSPDTVMRWEDAISSAYTLVCRQKGRTPINHLVMKICINMCIKRLFVQLSCIMVGGQGAGCKFLDISIAHEINIFPTAVPSFHLIFFVFSFPLVLLSNKSNLRYVSLIRLQFYITCKQYGCLHFIEIMVYFMCGLIPKHPTAIDALYVDSSTLPAVQLTPALEYWFKPFFNRDTTRNTDTLFRSYFQGFCVCGYFVFRWWFGANFVRVVSNLIISTQLRIWWL